MKCLATFLVAIVMTEWLSAASSDHVAEALLTSFLERVRAWLASVIQRPRLRGDLWLKRR